MMMMNIVDIPLTVDGSLVASVVGLLVEPVVDKVTTVSVADMRMLELLLVNTNNVYNIINIVTLLLLLAYTDQEFLKKRQ